MNLHVTLLLSSADPGRLTDVHFAADAETARATHTTLRHDELARGQALLHDQPGTAADLTHLSVLQGHGAALTILTGPLRAHPTLRQDLIEPLLSALAARGQTRVHLTPVRGGVQYEPAAVADLLPGVPWAQRLLEVLNRPRTGTSGTPHCADQDALSAAELAAELARDLRDLLGTRTLN